MRRSEKQKSFSGSLIYLIDLDSQSPEYRHLILSVDGYSHINMTYDAVRNIWGT